VSSLPSADTWKRTGRDKNATFWVASECSTVKLEFHDADTDTDTDILAKIFANTSDSRFPEVIPMASSPTRRHSHEDVGEEVRIVLLDVGVRVRVGAVECQLYATLGPLLVRIDTENPYKSIIRLKFIFSRICSVHALQADHRFRDNVDTLDQLGFHLDGMPSPSRRPAGGEPTSSADAVVSRALDDLTRVAPFLEAAVDGELRHERGRHFVHDYRRILDDAEHGFYGVLCQLHRLTIAAADGPAGAAAARRPAAVSLPAAGETVQSNAIRHYRDYVVLRDFGRLLDSYRHQLWHRRGLRGRSSPSSSSSSSEV